MPFYAAERQKYDEQKEYIEAIKFELGFFRKRRRKAVRYFEGYFLSAENAEAVYECLGDPKTAAKLRKTLLNEKKIKAHRDSRMGKATALILAAPGV